MAVQLEGHVSVDLLVNIQQGVWMSDADNTFADRTIRRNRAELPVPSDGATGLVRRKCHPTVLTHTMVMEWIRHHSY